MAALGRGLPGFWRVARLFYGWVILAVICAVSFARQGAAVATLSIFIAPMTAELGWSRTAISGAVSLAGVIAALTSPLLGPLVDRHGAGHAGGGGAGDGGGLRGAGGGQSLLLFYVFFASPGPVSPVLRSRYLRGAEQLVCAVAADGHLHLDPLADGRPDGDALDRPFRHDRRWRLAVGLAGDRRHGDGVAFFPTVFLLARRPEDPACNRMAGRRSAAQTMRRERPPQSRRSPAAKRWVPAPFGRCCCSPFWPIRCRPALALRQARISSK